MTARNNKTRLPLLHHHTPVVSVAAERLCVPQLEEAGFLKREKKKARVIRVCVIGSFTRTALNTRQTEHAHNLTIECPFQLLLLLLNCSEPVLLCLPVQVLPSLSHLSTKLEQHYSNVTATLDRRNFIRTREETAETVLI